MQDREEMIWPLHDLGIAMRYEAVSHDQPQGNRCPLLKFRERRSARQPVEVHRNLIAG